MNEEGDQGGDDSDSHSLATTVVTSTAEEEEETRMEVLVITGESEEESRDSDTRSGVSELEMRMIRDWEESDPDITMVAEKVDPKADPLEEETEVIEGVFESDEDSPIDLKTSI